MIKKLLKRGLSFLLALVLVVTTFFIFDPDLLRVESDAYVDVGAANVGKFLSSQSLSATETIYLKPGTSEFQYYENYNYQTGEVGANPVDSSGSIFFKNNDATAVYLVVNNVYEKGSSTTASGKLTINGIAINTYAKLANGSDNYTQGDIFAQASSGEINYAINSGSLTGVAEGKVYIIEWLIGYEIGGVLHYAFAYTGVYAPVLGQAGVTYDLGREYAGSTLYQQGYSFLTGAMKYGGGNAKSKFTNPNVINVAGGIGSNTTFTAPLVSFVGYASNSSNFTVPGNAQVANAYQSTTLFGQGSGDVGGGVLVSPRRMNKSTVQYRTDWQNTGSYDNPNPVGTTLVDDADDDINFGQTTGVGYILVDKSRYTTYDNIPNLSLGWAQFQHHYHGGANGLHRISALDSAHNAVSSVNVVNFSSADWESGDEEGRSYTRGLFHIGGTVRDGLTEFEFYTTNRYNFGLGSASGDFYTTVALHTTTYSQKELRQSYNSALCSLVDYYNITNYASGLEYISYYTALKATGEKLADPTVANTSVDTTLTNFVTNAKKAIEASTATKVYFYVPEVIYLTPSTAGATTAVAFKWFADRANADEGALTSNVAGKTSGNVYFHCEQAKSFKISVSKPAGCTVSGVTLDSTITGNKLSAAMSGSAYNTQGQKITWTLTWTNAGGQSFTVERTSTIYKPNYVASGGAGKSERTNSADWGKKGYMSGIIYVNGFANSYTGGSWKVKDSANTSLVPGWTRTGSNQGPANYLDSQSGGPIAFNDSYQDTVSQTISGLNLYLDRSRYANYSGIPNLTWTVAVTDYQRTDSEKSGYFGYDAASGNIWNVASNNLNEGVYWGQINAATPAASTSASSHYFQGYFKGKYGGTGQTTVKINFNCYSFDKSGLRDAYDYAMLKSNFLQKDYYTDAAWSAYTTALNNVIDALQGVENTAVGSYGSYATTLKNQIEKMIGAVTASGDTFSYTPSGTTTPVTGQNRADVVKKGTATVHHVMIDFDDEGNLITSTSGTTLGETETKTYYAGETVYTGANDYEGYNYFGYYRSEAGTKWTASLGESVLSGDVAAQGTYRSTADNVDEFVRTYNLAYTYVYSKDLTGVYMDWGQSEQAFKNRQNLADISKTAVNINTAFTEDGTLYGETATNTTVVGSKYSSSVSIVDKTGPDSFSFSVLSPGYNTYTPKGRGVNNLFTNFDNYNWTVASDRASISVDTTNDTFTIVGNGTNSDIYTDWGGASRGIKGQANHTYKLVFDVQNNNENAPIDVGSMWFTYAETDTGYGSWGQVDNIRAGSGDRMHVDAGASATYETQFTVPAGYPNFSVRIQLNTADGNATYSNVNVYDITDSTQFAKMTDIFLPKVATGLQGGKTYTVSFKSSLRYDDYRWYAVDMYGNPSPEMDWAHEQGTIQTFISTTYGSDVLHNYTVPIRVTTSISEGGTIGTFYLPEGCTDINLGFCITNDTAIGGWVSDIRICEGDYVEIGSSGEKYTLPDPLREGHTFTGWSQGSTPFYGNLNGKEYTYGIKSDTVVANWDINRYDVTFDNEFDFDLGWDGPSASNGTIDFNPDENKFTLKTLSNASSSDNTVLSNSIVDLIPGHTYRLSYDYDVKNYVSGGGMQNHIFLYGNETDAKSNAWSAIGFIGQNASLPFIKGSVYPSVSGTNQRTGTVVLEFTVPTTAEFARLRLGNTNQNGMEIEFSNIYWQDISRGATTVVIDTSVSEPQYNGNNIRGVIREFKQNLLIEGSDLTTMPTMESDAYHFDGWFTEKTGGTKVDDVTNYVTQAKTNQLWSHWTVHIEYDLSEEGGSFKEGFTAPGESELYPLGTQETLINYVPYKVGHNFGGWKCKFDNQTYTPGQTVTLNYSLILEPIWIEATPITKEPPAEQLGYNNVTTLYPGQVYFYAYTPAANDEYVSGYAFGAAATDLSVALYNSSSVIVNGTTPKDGKIYGVTAVDSIASGALTQGTEYYFGLTGTNTTDVADYSDAYFKVSEHYVQYMLDPVDGVVDPSAVIGHYKVNPNTATPTALPTPSKPGNTFHGWKYDDVTSFTGSVPNDKNNGFINTGVSGELSFVTTVNLTAKWSVNSYNLNVHAYYNTAVNSTTVSTAYTLGETGGYVVAGDKRSEGGSATIPVEYQTTAECLAVPYTGYEFKGWYDNPTFTGSQITDWGNVYKPDANATISSMPANDLDLYARFDIKTYRVQVFAYTNSSNDTNVYQESINGGTVALDSSAGAISVTSTYVHGQSYTMIATPAAGYTFGGWYFGDNDFGGVAAFSSATQAVTVTSDLRYKAKFSVQKYYLYVNANSGTVTQDLYEGFVGGQVEIEEPTRVGYTFTGWTIADNATQGIPNGTLGADKKTYTFGPGDDSATANWSVNNYPVTINPNGGKAVVEYTVNGASSASSITIYESTEINMDYNTVTHIKTPTREGHTFAGWEINDVSESVKNRFDPGSGGNDATFRVDVETEEVIITARWEVNAYRLYVDAYGDDSGANLDKYVIRKGGTVKIGADGTPAQSVDAYVNYGETAKLYAFPDTGYEFIGWTTKIPTTRDALQIVSENPDGTETVAMGTNGLNYYAVFGIKKFTVSLETECNNPNDIENFTPGTAGGTVTGEGEFCYNESATVKATPATGYEFDGWYVNGELVSTSPSYNVRVTDNVTYTGRFKVAKYTINPVVMSNYANNVDEFLINESAGTVKGDREYYYTKTTYLEAQANPGYRFLGWYDNSGLEGTPIESTTILEETVLGNKSYYAKFEVIKVSVNLYAMSNAGLDKYEMNTYGGTVSLTNEENSYGATASGECYYDGEYYAYAKAETGYVFDGWYKNSDLSGDALVGTHIPEGGYDEYKGVADGGEGVTLYAKFSVNSYNLDAYAYSNSGVSVDAYTNNSVGGTVNIESDYCANAVTVTDEGAVATVKIYFDRNATVTAKAKTGYSFEGWFTGYNRDDGFINSQGMGNYDSVTDTYSLETAAMIEAGLKYYAKFDVGSFTISYDTNGGSDIIEKSGTAYYDTVFLISSEVPEKAGHSFLGWSVNNPTASQEDYVPGAPIDANVISEWYINNEGEDVTLYAVWVIDANVIIAYAAHSEANDVYTIGNQGGTVTVVSKNEGESDGAGSVYVPASATVIDYLKIEPAKGYGLVRWGWKTLNDDFAEGSSINSSWGTTGSGETTMPSKTLYVVAFFAVQTFDADAFAYYNTATATDRYIPGAGGGTVKSGQTGQNASSVPSDSVNYGTKVLFVATPAKGYEFIGWYATPDKTDGVVTEWGTPLETKTEFYPVIDDDTKPGTETVNHYYAVFSIKAYTATASIRTYSVREDLIYSLESNFGGDASDAGGKVGLGLAPYGQSAETDAKWKWSEQYNLRPTLKDEEAVYYGVRVYFEAVPNPGYVFGGWYDAEDADYYGENLVDEENLEYSRIMREGGIYMEAKFVPMSFSLVLHENGGSQGNPSEIVLTYNEDFRIEPSSIPTWTGHSFLGWADSPDASAEEAVYNVGLITYKTVNTWFDEVYDKETEELSSKTLYAIWEIAYIKVEFDKQGAEGGTDDVEITTGSGLPPIEEVPTYEGFVFGGYFSSPAGKGVQYYNADGSATGQQWNNTQGGTIYAKWTCPVLKDIEYNGNTWVYTYQEESAGETVIESETPVTDISGITELAADDSELLWWTVSVDEPNTEFVEAQLEETPDINLNHYSQAALSDLYAAVLETDDEKEINALTQPQANAYVARMAKDLDLNFDSNVKTEKEAPTVTIYENAERLNVIKDQTITNKQDSANGSTYSYPNESSSANYVYANKWSYTEETAVDYYLYTNSKNPVIALEIGDGNVATTIEENTSSYPTKATISSNAAAHSSYVTDSHMESAVQATDDIENAWFNQYTKAGIGTKHDYNAKTVIYLTPEFKESAAAGTQNEIVYTISASDDARVENKGIQQAELSSTDLSMKANFTSYQYDKTTNEGDVADDITICICYHNSMNGESDEGTLDASGPYMQMYMDQVNLDKMINMLHLQRIAGGASNWEFPTISENVYPVVDKNYPYTDPRINCTLGSFMYVFDSTNEPTAASYAAAGNYDSAKQAIIESVVSNGQMVGTILADRSNKNNLASNKEGLGFVQITGWSNNFFPKTGSYVYAHLVDRWGNVFNRVWKCYNVDSYPSTILGGEGIAVYDVFEDGGSNINTVTLDGAEVEFILDDNSTYADGVYSTSGNTVTLATGEANKTYNLTVTDYATNTNTVEVTTDGDGMLVLNVEDTCADLSSGAYTFTLNGETVNLYAGVKKLVYSATITEASLVGDATVVTAKASADVTKLQLVEGLATRTFTRDNAQVVENEDGTFTWTMSFKTTKGTHTYGLRARTVSGWETTEFVLSTEIVDKFVSTPTVLKSVYDAKVYVGEKPVIKARTQVGTEKLQIVYENGATATYSRSNAVILNTVDDIETWALTASTAKSAGEYKVTVRAKYNGKWQDESAKTSTIVATEKVVDTKPVIYSVEPQVISAKIYDHVTFKVVTNDKATKVRFNCANGSTWTFSESLENTVDNGDGTKTWTVAVKFYAVGETEINFSTRSAEGWIDGQSYGTIEITQ